MSRIEHFYQYCENCEHSQSFKQPGMKSPEGINKECEFYRNYENRNFVFFFSIFVLESNFSYRTARLEHEEHSSYDGQFEFVVKRAQGELQMLLKFRK